ncbi:heptaprenylglyceryl phosphate synthase [Paenibacillus herberti]|uniref:Geranylgeranylglyceryl/heptaprenylglyceryl phosphate synthase n=1 Tax=Paenibacillus herberti TaxID=1619309 RepID=A0A229NYV6_9BACL|nr:heptaprenylglyceryl phosphate synthase [Paenibacillus herberti]OXM14951.1 geranylgeranylglyceryl/heptaprenylglyceryl phosphate synthase [Paenibacillus herberti]
MKELFSDWRHVFKLDPDRTLPQRELEAVLGSGTDAIMVGGSSGLTYDNTAALLERLTGSDIPIVLEVTHPELALPGFDAYLIPMVLNTGQGDWITGRQALALEEMAGLIPWEKTWAEGYLILNEDCEAARVSGADASLTEFQAAAYARLADRLMRLPLLYVEYSGRFGDMGLLRRVKRVLSGTRLIYGGGIDGPQRASQAARIASTVVVGNVLYHDLDGALSTVQAVRETEQEI